MKLIMINKLQLYCTERIEYVFYSNYLLKICSILIFSITYIICSPIASYSNSVQTTNDITINSTNNSTNSPISSNIINSSETNNSDEANSIINPTISNKIETVSDIKFKIEDLITQSKILIKEKNYTEPMQKLNQAILYAKQYKLFKLYVKILLSKSDVSYQQQQWKNMISDLTLADKLARQHRVYGFTTRIYLNLAIAFFEINDINVSLSYFEKVLSLTQSKQIKAETLYNLYLLHTKEGDLPLSKQYLADYQNIKKSLGFKFVENFKKIRTVKYNTKWKISKEHLRNDKSYIEANSITIRIIDKIAARNYSFERPIGSEISFSDNLKIRTLFCWLSPSHLPKEHLALVEIFILPKKKAVFSGWLFSSHTGINSMSHPLYDVILTSCK